MLRQVSLADASDIAAIYNKYVEGSTISFETEPLTVEVMRGRIEHISARFPYYVLEGDGRVLAYCYAHEWKERAAYRHTWETTIYVDADCRGRGIGTMLMRRLIDECRAAGAHALIACITADNEASIAFHERLGFHRVSLFREVGRKFGQWLDVVDCELILD